MGDRQHYRRYRHQEFLRFLKLIDATVPDGLDLHLVCDSYAQPTRRGGPKWPFVWIKTADEILDTFAAYFGESTTQDHRASPDGLFFVLKGKSHGNGKPNGIYMGGAGW